MMFLCINLLDGVISFSTTNNNFFMLQQAKNVREVLKGIGATRDGEKTIKVRTKRKYIGRNSKGRNVYEYGNAVAHTDALTDEQITKAKEINKYIEIYNNRELNFAILEF